MVAIAEVSWQDVMAGNFPTEPPTRKAWRMVVQEIAAKAYHALPACNGRIDKAVQIVLADDVVLFEDGRATVGSQSDAGLHYVVNDACECPDSDKAPDGWCKHRLAASIYKGAIALVQERRAQQEPPQGQEQGHTWQSAQAPSSCTLKWQVGGIELMLTLRDSTDEALFQRIKRVLPRIEAKMDAQRQAQEQAQRHGQPPSDDWCPMHQVPMRRYTKDGRSWYSHKAPDGSWCQGK
jgi:hypothetical protein